MPVIFIYYLSVLVLGDLMRKLMWFRLAEKDVHLPKLIGAFLLFGSLLMFFQAGATMFSTWDEVSYLDECLLNARDDSAMIQDCRTTLYNNSGVYLRPGEGKLSSRQFWSLMLAPIGGLMLWAIVFLIGVMFYRTGNLVVPIEETSKNVAVRSFKKKKRR